MPDSALLPVQAAVLTRTPVVVIESAKTELRLTDQDLVALFQANARTIDRWKKGGSYPQSEARARMGELEALIERLRDTFTTVEARRAWMHHATPFLGQLSPADALRAGRIDRVNATLEALDSGIAI